MIDIADQLTTTYREVRTGPCAADPSAAHAVTGTGIGIGTGAGAGAAELPVGLILRRFCPADPAGVWDALTRRRRLARWFGPVTGCATPGAGFTVPGRASGRVLDRDPRHSLTLSWHEAGTVGTVAVRMAADGDDRTVVEVTHTVERPEAPWGADRSAPGAAAAVLAAGPAWDLALLALRRHLEGTDGSDAPRAAGQKFAQHALSAWVNATIAAGLASADELTRTVGDRMRHLAPDLTG